MTTVTIDPIKARGDPWRFNHPRYAAQLTAAGAVNERNPATTPIPKAEKRMRSELMKIS
jgi:hypothetical protein